ncbi:U3 snoRNP protein [Nowakowskiella sp. JEL0078]|nr:U3 snoRNP protein [Nowakowskiella sp. JEL0078]
MAESVHYHVEKMLPELLHLQENNTFSAGELKAIIKKRTDFEYSIHRRIPLKKDYLNYIQYELNLEKLRKKRRKRVLSQLESENPISTNTSKIKKKPSDKSKLNATDSSIVRRIHSLYNKALKKWNADVELWNLYFEWAIKEGSNKALGRSFAK